MSGAVPGFLEALCFSRDAHDSCFDASLGHWLRVAVRGSGVRGFGILLSSNRPEAGLRVRVGPHASARGPATHKKCRPSRSDYPSVKRPTPANREPPNREPRLRNPTASQASNNHDYTDPSLARTAGLQLDTQLLAAAILLQTLFFKFTGAEESVYIFSTLGVEPAGRIGSGVVELIAALLLLVPSTVAAGALVALGVMAGRS